MSICKMMKQTKHTFKKKRGTTHSLKKIKDDIKEIERVRKKIVTCGFHIEKMIKIKGRLPAVDNNMKRE